MNIKGSINHAIFLLSVKTHASNELFKSLLPEIIIFYHMNYSKTHASTLDSIGNNQTTHVEETHKTKDPMTQFENYRIGLVHTLKI